LIRTVGVLKAINNAGTSVGILAKDGVVMASEKKVTSGLLAPARVRICTRLSPESALDEALIFSWSTENCG